MSESDSSTDVPIVPATDAAVALEAAGTDETTEPVEEVPHTDASTVAPTGAPPAAALDESTSTSAIEVEQVPRADQAPSDASSTSNEAPNTEHTAKGKPEDSLPGADGGVADGAADSDGADVPSEAPAGEGEAMTDAAAPPVPSVSSKKATIKADTPKEADPAAKAPSGEDKSGDKAKSSGKRSSPKSSKGAEKHRKSDKKKRSKHTAAQDVISTLRKSMDFDRVDSSAKELGSNFEEAVSGHCTPSRTKADGAGRAGNGDEKEGGAVKNDGGVSRHSGKHNAPVIDIPAPGEHRAYRTSRKNAGSSRDGEAPPYTGRAGPRSERHRHTDGPLAGEGKENEPYVSPLTLINVGKHVRESGGMTKGFTARPDCRSDSSGFKSCVSLTSSAPAPSRNRRNVYTPRSKRIEETGKALQKLNIPAYHRRLILDLHQRNITERYAAGNMVEDWMSAPYMEAGYSMSPEKWGRNGASPEQSARYGISPAASPRAGYDYSQRRNYSVTAGGRHEHHPRSAFNSRSPERAPYGMDNKMGNEPSYKPVISNYARRLRRSRIPCHERLYSARPASRRAKDSPGGDDETPPSTPRKQDLASKSDFELFRPHISKRARALSFAEPFYSRLHPPKRERVPSPPPEPPKPVPRLSSMKPIRVSARLLRRPTPPPPDSPPSFRPKISARARSVEPGRPFYDRLHPGKVERPPKQKAKQTTPRVSPRRSMSRRSTPAIPERLLEPPPPPPYEKYDPTFRPEISPRARALERDEPFYKRLYLTPFELEEAHALQKRRQFEHACNLQPDISERGRQAYNEKKLRRGPSKPIKAHRERH
uniref:WGS project CAEQ00000000 data, annotated contig 1735 n=1 Tax=Trypanosoma congolense (strain IL3000) TaxID=1068625 RepID=F9W8G5_TRYCI|nr:unnamed protein product [Trypanosoma congolense IL3000]